MLFDTHTHVNFQPFQKTYQEVIQRALDAGIFINNVGSQWESSERSVQIAEEFSHGVWASVGVHPIHVLSDVTEYQEFGGTKQMIRTRAEEFDYERYKTLAQSSKKVIAIGECGLDYLHFERAGLQDQREALMKKQESVLRQHIDLALELDLPLVIHCRDAEKHRSGEVAAFEDLIRIISDYQNSNKKTIRGVIHCYTGTPEYISRFLDLGMYIGFTGIVTFSNAVEVQNSLKLVPMNRILLETDAPYLAPTPHRGKQNEPAFVRFVAEKIAELRQANFEEVAEQTTNNAFELFKISS